MILRVYQVLNRGSERMNRRVAPSPRRNIGALCRCWRAKARLATRPRRGWSLRCLPGSPAPCSTGRGRERLLDETGFAVSRPLLTTGLVRVTGHEEYFHRRTARQPGSARSRPPSFGITTSAISRWMGPLCAGDPPGVRGVGRVQNLVAFAPQGVAHQVAHLILILDQQDGFGAARRFGQGSFVSGAAAGRCAADRPSRKCLCRFARIPPCRRRSA
jgi:hypothetical protein